MPRQVISLGVFEGNPAWFLRLLVAWRLRGKKGLFSALEPFFGALSIDISHFLTFLNG
jgi:hypothetical protein